MMELYINHKGLYVKIDDTLSGSFDDMKVVQELEQARLHFKKTGEVPTLSFRQHSLFRA